MSVLNSIKRSGAVLLAVGALTAGTMFVTAGSAAAAAGQFVLCAKGSYAASVEFPARHMSTVMVNPGNCLTMKFGLSTAVEEIRVFGYQYPSLFWITNGRFRPSAGGQVTTYGTSAHPWASTPVA